MISDSKISIFTNSEKYEVNKDRRLSYEDVMRLAGYGESMFGNFVVIDELTKEEYKYNTGVHILPRDNLSLVIYYRKHEEM